MREILFKAKCIEGGNWIFGDLIHHLDGATIGTSESDGLHELYIDKKTVCQYVGKNDKNNKKIWENDIVVTDDGERLLNIVKFKKGGFMLVGITKNINSVFFDEYATDETEVIGNIFDNPELLKGGEE